MRFDGTNLAFANGLVTGIKIRFYKPNPCPPTLWVSLRRAEDVARCESDASRTCLIVLIRSSITARPRGTKGGPTERVSGALDVS